MKKNQTQYDKIHDSECKQEFEGYLGGINVALILLLGK